MPETRLHISPLVYIGGLLVFLVLAGIATLLVMQLSVLRDSREHIVATDAKVTELEQRLNPTLTEARPALRQAEPLLREARGLVEPIEETTTSVIAAADALPVALAAGIDLIDQIEPLVNQIEPLVERAKPLASAALTLVQRATPVFDSVAPVVRELDTALDSIPHIEDLAVILTRIQRRSVRLLLRSLRTQQRTERLLFESIGIQRELLKHARSIDQKLGGTVGDRTLTAPLVSPAAMRFEKWNALGNDYMIVEAAELPWELTPERIRRICALHSGMGSDGILLLAPPRERGFVAAPADLQPGRVGGRAVRQRRARGDHVPAPARLDRAGRVLDRDGGRRDPAADHRADDVHRRHGPGASRAAGDTLESAGREFSYQDLQIGNPQCAVELPADEDLAAFDLNRTARRSRRTPTSSRTARTCRSGSAIRQRDHRAHLRARRGGDDVVGHRSDRRGDRIRAPRRRLAR